MSLRAAFKVNSLSTCGKALRILWADGVESTFPSTWLRAAVRNAPYFDDVATMYQFDHLSFLQKPSVIASVENKTAESNEDEVAVSWEDFSSNFNASWLRAQDSKACSNFLAEYGVQRKYWDSREILPQYEYARKEQDFESWMYDIQKWGIVVINGVPATEKAYREFLNLMGPLAQRNHPTNIFVMEQKPRPMAMDPPAYGRSFFGAHTDASYYTVPKKILAFQVVEYSAPEGDTDNFFVDGFRVVEDLRKEDPEAFALLTSVPLRQSRRRMGLYDIQPPEVVRKHLWDACLDTPPIVMSPDGKTLERLQTRWTKHAGVPLEAGDDELMTKYYKAYSTLQMKLDDSKYHQCVVMEPGVMVVFDNHRLVHGRSSIHSSTYRKMNGAFIAPEIWESRWRILLGKRSGLPDKWLFGCSTDSLEVLANRKSN